MPNYTVQQALALSDLSAGAREYLERLNKSGIDKIRNKVFTATSQAALKRLIEESVAAKAEADTVKLDDCLNVIRSMCKGSNGNRRLISPKELLPKLEDLKKKVEAEKKFSKVDKLVESSGMTKEQLIEYLQTL